MLYFVLAKRKGSEGVIWYGPMDEQDVRCHSFLLKNPDLVGVRKISLELCWHLADAMPRAEEEPR